ncbi:MAG TPA: sigma-54 dependent transcriptional regulator [Candidatus Krumholzibacteria bacterium]|nr:sigma-54 dependent transcriptional regulator [Candidatus Krumholzibacteria bacterium]
MSPPVDALEARGSPLPPPGPDFVGESPPTRELLSLVARVAGTEAPVLITGESGTGKEILARTIHARSRRRDGPFVPVNCGAIVDTLEESELFGHVAGAFTGAHRRKTGKFEAAHGGSIFLDEIGEMSLHLQVKLLRILQDGEYAPVGMVETCHADARVIAATNQDLNRLVDTRQFRADLFYRLNVVRLEVSPLRRRRDDIPLLLHHFVRAYSSQYGRPEPDIDPDVERALQDYDFPGNVRELSNVIQRAIILGTGPSLTLAALPDEIRHPSSARGNAGPRAHEARFREAKRRLIEEFEREYLIAIIQDCGGIVSRAARRAGLSDRIMHQKLRAYGIDSRSFRAMPDPSE